MYKLTIKGFNIKKQAKAQITSNSKHLSGKMPLISNIGR